MTSIRKHDRGPRPDLLDYVDAEIVCAFLIALGVVSAIWVWNSL